MSTAKIAISIDEKILSKVDNMVKMRMYPSRSRAIQDAVEEKISMLDRSRLARESAKLNPKFEKQMAEEGFSEELSEWPEY